MILFVLRHSQLFNSRAKTKQSVCITSRWKTGKVYALRPPEAERENKFHASQTFNTLYNLDERAIDQFDVDLIRIQVWTCKTKIAIGPS